MTDESINSTDQDNALLETMRGLKPTEGKWEFDRGLWANNGTTWILGGAYGDGTVEAFNLDDAKLIALAPALSDLALRQADELAAIKRVRDERRSTSAAPWFLATGNPIPDDQLDAYYEGLDDGLYNAHEARDAELDGLRAELVSRDAQIEVLKAENVALKDRVKGLVEALLLERQYIHCHKYGNGDWIVHRIHNGTQTKDDQRGFTERARAVERANHMADRHHIPANRIFIED
jgi:CheY-like chemotaxis protein